MILLNVVIAVLLDEFTTDPPSQRDDENLDENGCPTPSMDQQLDVLSGSVEQLEETLAAFLACADPTTTSGNEPRQAGPPTYGVSAAGPSGNEPQRTTPPTASGSSAAGAHADLKPRVV